MERELRRDPGGTPVDTKNMAIFSCFSIHRYQS